MKRHPSAITIRVLTLLLCAGALLNCGVHSRPETGIGKLQHILITPANPNIPKGATVELTATGYFANGTQDLTGLVTWESRHPNIAAINGQGAVVGRLEGVAQISASYDDVTATTTATVGSAALVSIAVSPNPSSLPMGESVQLAATGTFSDGSTQNLTQSVTWSSSEAGIATVGPSGSATGNAAGASIISATTGTTTGSANLTVTPAVAVALNIVPSTLSLALGNSSQVQVIATMSDGSNQNMTQTASWILTPSGVASVTAGGLVTATKVGSTTLTAQTSNLTASARLMVGPPVLVSVTVSPNSLSLPVGESQQFSANGKFSDQSVQNLTQSATWSSSASGIATVDKSGSAQAKATGTATITATSGSLSGSASLTVIAPAMVSLNIQPAKLSMVVGSGRQLQAIGTLSDGTTKDMTQKVDWSSASSDIVSVNSLGQVTAQQIGSTTILAVGNGLTATASVTVVPLALLNYFDRKTAKAAGIDGTVRLTNPDATTICAMVYVFDESQEMNECCGCSISESGIRTMSLFVDFTGNPLTGKKPPAGIIRVVPSDISKNKQCDASSLSPTGSLEGWGTNVQAGAQGDFQVTETSFETVPLTSGEATYLAGLCGFIEQLGSGRGICSCGSGG